MSEDIIKKCEILLDAFKNQELGYMEMPEESNPRFTDDQFENRLSYFSLPMSLNYQRNSYSLWESALKTVNDPETKSVFDVSEVVKMNDEELRTKLIKHKLALQPNKHINTWKKISETIHINWGSFTNLIKTVDYNFLKLKLILQRTHKKGFPYLSGPKIFNYWSYILGEYCDVNLSNKQWIEIAPDTHVIQASIKLGVITEEEKEISREKISQKWREILNGTNISPIDMHSPLWFWSRNNFQYEL